MKNNKGFTLLISIITTSMLLIVSFVVINVALKQLIIANSNQESQYAFYAADSGTECAVFWDLKDSTLSAFATSTTLNPSASITCNGQTITTGSQTSIATNPVSTSRIGGGGSSNQTSIFQLDFTKGCAIVRVTKQNDGQTLIDSRGYNTCSSSAARRLERGVTLLYLNEYSGSTPAATKTWNLTGTVVGNGTITGNGLNCSPTCLSTLNDGTSISLSANPTSGNVLSGWSGPTGCTTTTCAFTLTADTSVTATFSVVSSATISWTGPTSGSQNLVSNGTLGFTTPGTYTVTPSVNMTVLVKGAAGGGSGAGSCGGGCGAGAGGGSGAVNTTGVSTSLVANTPYTVVVGAGGTGVSVSPLGNNGANSSFGSILSLGKGSGATGSAGGSGGSVIVGAGGVAGKSGGAAAVGDNPTGSGVPGGNGSCNSSGACSGGGGGDGGHMTNFGPEPAGSGGDNGISTATRAGKGTNGCADGGYLGGDGATGGKGVVFSGVTGSFGGGGGGAGSNVCSSGVAGGSGQNGVIVIQFVSAP